MIGWLVGIGLAAWAVARLGLGYARPERSMQVLAAREVALLRAASDATFPPGSEFGVSGTEAGIPEYLDRYLAALPPRNRLLIRLLLMLFEQATIFLPAPGWDGWRRFSKLSHEQQMAVVESWGTSRLRARRMVFTSLRTILTMGYLGCPTVLRAMGLAPLRIDTPVVDADLLYPAVGRSRDTIRWGPDDRRPLDPTPLDPHGPLHPDYAERA